MSQLRSVSCHMGSHTVTFYPTQVNAPRGVGRRSDPSWVDGKGQIGSGNLAESFLSIFMQKRDQKLRI